MPAGGGGTRGGPGAMAGGAPACMELVARGLMARSSSPSGAWEIALRLPGPGGGAAAVGQSRVAVRAQARGRCGPEAQLHPA